jgi:hypothetical protein
MPDQFKVVKAETPEEFEEKLTFASANNWSLVATHVTDLPAARFVAVCKKAQAGEAHSAGGGRRTTTLGR